MNRILATIAALALMVHMTMGCCWHASAAEATYEAARCSHDLETCPTDEQGRHRYGCDAVVERSLPIEGSLIPSTLCVLCDAPSRCAQLLEVGAGNSPDRPFGQLRSHLALGVLLI